VKAYPFQRQPDDLDGQGLRWFDVHLVDNRIRIIVQGLRGLACIRSV
jgi:hypothetical protein